MQIKIIICRERKWNDITFFEYLFEYDEKCHNLKFARWNKRYENRIKENKIIHVNNNEIKFVTVNSTPFEMEEFTNYKIKNSQGIWLLSNDVLKKGENKFQEIEGKRSFFSLEICEKDAQLLELLLNKLNISLHFPMVCYHGTDSVFAEKIQKEGLKESWGMLGKAVYVGTFWKACRFACFDKEYHEQQGKVFRVLSFAQTIQNFPMDPITLWKCPCSEDCNKHCSDHLGIWQIMNDGAHVEIGNEKGDLKNEEWAIKERFVFVTSYAEIQPYSYSPFKRNTQIK